MFRDANTRSEMSPAKFGVGSVCHGGGDILTQPKQSFVLVEDRADGWVAFMRMSDFKVIGEYVQVGDPNHLTEAEVRKVVSGGPGDLLQWAFSDFSFDAHSLKSINVRKARTS